MRDGKLGTAVEFIGSELWLIRAGNEVRRVKTVSTAPFACLVELPHMNETIEQRHWVKRALTSALAEQMVTATIIDSES